MSSVIEADILTADTDYIAHQVNCKGVVGGLAAALFAKYPKEYEWYRYRCSLPYVTPGWVDIGVTSKPMLVSIYGQNDPGPNTDYHAVEQALEYLEKYIGDAAIAFPYGMGCGIGGGDWSIMEPIILKYIPQAIFYKRR